MKDFLKELSYYNYWLIPIGLWLLSIFVGSIDFNNKKIHDGMLMGCFIVNIIIAIFATYKAYKFDK
ncbi:MAG: hypothetical protein LIR50_05305 [Bacillota bacterium]|nr:hypothetical protein [Bacillota bacterium]